MTLLIGCLSSLTGITGHTSPRQRPMVKRVQRYAFLLKQTNIWAGNVVKSLCFAPYGSDGLLKIQR